MHKEQNQDVIDQVVSYILLYGEKDLERVLSLTEVSNILLMADMSCMLKYGRAITQSIFLVYRNEMKPMETHYILDCDLIKSSLNRIDEINKILVGEDNYDWLAIVDKKEIRLMVNRYLMDWERFPVKFIIK